MLSLPVPRRCHRYNLRIKLQQLDVTLHVSNYFYSLSRLDGTRECVTAAYVVVGCRRPAVVKKEKEVKEVGLCSAFIVVPHTQGAQVRITQFYLQITPYYTSTS